MRYPLTARERERERKPTRHSEVDEEDDRRGADGGQPHAARRPVFELLGVRERRESDVVVARDVVVAVEGDAHHGDHAEDLRGEVPELDGGVDGGMGGEGDGDHAGGDEDGEDGDHGDVLQRIDRWE